MSNPKLNPKEESSAKRPVLPRRKPRWSSRCPERKKLKTDAEKTAEKAQHLRFGKAELTPDELSRLSKAQKREMYAAHAARSVVHREVDQYEDENVGVQALSEGEKGGRKCPGYFQEHLCPETEKESQDAGQEGCQNRTIFPRSRLRHKMQAHPAPARAAPTGSPDGGRNRTFGRVTMPPPIRVQRHRPQAAKRYPMAPLLRSLAWNRSSTKEDRWSVPQSTGLPILQRATHTFW